MKITKCTITNFRSIRSATIDFDVPLRLLFGMNEAGKSNVLRALALLDRNRPWESSDTRVPMADEQLEDGDITWDFELSDEDIDEITSSIRLRVIVGDRDVVATDGEETFTLREFLGSMQACAWVSNKRKLMVGTRVRPESETDQGRWMTLPPGSSGRDVAMSAGTFHIDGSSLIHARQLLTEVATFVSAAPGSFFEIIDDHVASFIESNLPRCVFWTLRPEYLLPATIDQATFSANPTTCIPLKNMFVLAGHHSPADALRASAATQFGTKQLLERIARVATEHLHRIWPEHNKIRLELQKDGTNIVAGVKDHENSYEFAQRSDGFKRFVAFLLTVSSQVRDGELSNALILVDEPDTSLHPSGTRLLRKELAELAKKNIVVGSSHSIFMVDANRIDEHLIVKRVNEVTTISKVDKSSVVDEEVIFNALGASVFELVRDHSIIFEGWRDKVLFRTGLKKLKPKSAASERLSQLGFTHAQGVNDVPKIAGLLEIAQRKFVVVSDADHPAKQRQADWRYSAPWYCYDDVLPTAKGFTAEDFLVEKHVAQVLHAWGSKRGGELPKFVPDPGKNMKDAIVRWLSPLSLDKASLNNALNEIKDGLFNDLQPSQVSDRYVEFLEGVSQKLPS